MPTPAATLYDFESNVEAAAKALLVSIGLTACYKLLEGEDELPATGYIQITASGFQRASEHKVDSADVTPVSFYNHYRGELSYVITTPRTPAGRALHSDWLSKIRAAHAAYINPFAALPYHLPVCAESGISVTFVRAGERDQSELQFSLELGIRGTDITFN